MNILALDPATRTGFAWTDGERIESGVWDFSGQAATGWKLLKLAASIRTLHNHLGIDAIAFEEASFGASGGGRKIQWPVIVFHNKLRGAIEMVATEIGAKLLPVGILTIKASVAGHGRADKSQVMRAVETHLGIRPGCDNEGDALAILIWAKGHPDGHIGKKQIAKRVRVAKKKMPKLF